MGEKSNIEWTDASWTPIRAHNTSRGKVGWHCEHLSEGCRNCYAEGMNARLGTGLPFKPGLVVNGKPPGAVGVDLFLDEKMLLAPLRWKKPRMIFVCSMTDVFANFVTDEWLDKMFAVMALCPQHTFQVLTKRAERMRAYLSHPNRDSEVAVAMLLISAGIDPVNGRRAIPDDGRQYPLAPLPNVWLGVSTERQQEADERIPLLLDTPAAVRFISAEPLLGPIYLRGIPIKQRGRGLDADSSYPKVLDALNGFVRERWNQDVNDPQHGGDFGRLDWVIVGGESGKGARPMHPDWARDLRDQCAASATLFFFKQWGSWFPSVDRDIDDPDWQRDYGVANRNSKYRILNAAGGMGFHGERVHLMQRYSKAAAGRLLDGIEHNGMPNSVAASATPSPIPSPLPSQWNSKEGKSEHDA